MEENRNYNGCYYSFLRFLFVNYNVNLQMMVGCGLIGVLVEKLAEFTKAHCRVHSEALLVETMGPMSPKSPTWSWPRSPSPPPLSPPLATSPSLADYSPRCSTPATDTGEDSDTPTPLVCMILFLIIKTIVVNRKKFV